MKNSHITEILFLLLASLGGILIYALEPSWLGFIVGIIILFFCSSLVSNLKKQTIKEFINKCKETKAKQGGSS